MELEIVTALRDAANGTGSTKNDRGDLGLLEDAADLIEKMHHILASAQPDQFPGAFICGSGGKEEGGLNQSYEICPMYGADFHATGRYVRIDKLGRDQGAIEILHERQRQVQEEGWTPEHDDQYRNGELLQAAMAYIMNDKSFFPKTWDKRWFKPYTSEQDLTRAGGLVASEISRLFRERKRIQSIKDPDFGLRPGIYKTRCGLPAHVHGMKGKVTEQFPWYGLVPEYLGMDGWCNEGRSKFYPSFDLVEFVSLETPE